MYRGARVCYTKYLLSNMQYTICVSNDRLYLTKINRLFYQLVGFRFNFVFLCHSVDLVRLHTVSFSLLCVCLTAVSIYLSIYLSVACYFFPIFFCSTNVHLCVCVHIFIVGYFCIIFVLSHRGEFDSHRVIIILWLFHDTKCCQTKTTTITEKNTIKIC